MSIRSQRVAATIRNSVQRVISKGLSDPRIRGMVTVTGVEMDEDLRHANIKVSVLPAEHADLTLHGLRAAAKHVRHLIADDLVLPQTPRLHFKLDVGAGKQAGVLSALAEVRRELESEPSDDPGASPPGADQPSTNEETSRE